MSATDDDIAYRDLFLVDIDRAGHTKNPASDQEIEASRVLADEISKFLAAHGWPNPVRVMSGNGHHLYYVLKDMANTNEATDLVQRALQNLALKFDNDAVKVDTSVFNASRITKVPGTIMRKGCEAPDRPYRIAVVL